MIFKFNSIQEYRKKLGAGHSEIVTKFAFFPITINGELRWLENVKYERQLSYINVGNQFVDDFKLKWKNVRFI